MSAYEAMFIFRPDINEEAHKALVQEMENIIKNNQATITESQMYGRKQLAYEIKKCKEGLYHLINFSALTGVVPDQLKHACSINESVIRVLILKREEKKLKA
ncbi:MAG: 30S ribosomal protein S6 [Candidatus Omnitrophota bacterium]